MRDVTSGSKQQVCTSLLVLLGKWYRSGNKPAQGWNTFHHVECIIWWIENKVKPEIEYLALCLQNMKWGFSWCWERLFWDVYLLLFKRFFSILLLSFNLHLAALKGVSSSWLRRHQNIFKLPTVEWMCNITWLQPSFLWCRQINSRMFTDTFCHLQLMKKCQGDNFQNNVVIVISSPGGSLDQSRVCCSPLCLSTANLTLCCSKLHNSMGVQQWVHDHVVWLTFS